MVSPLNSRKSTPSGNLEIKPKSNLFFSKKRSLPVNEVDNLLDTIFTRDSSAEGDEIVQKTKSPSNSLKLPQLIEENVDREQTQTEES